jgi:cbb3-type cytochrome c oxidase subunit III
MPLAEKNLVKSRRWFVLVLCLAVSLPVGIAAWRARADDAAAGVQPPPGQDETIAVMPAPGMSGDPVAQPVTMPTDPQQAAIIKRGEYLAVAGDCQYCHSIPGGAPYAGGQPVQSPFGDLVTPNITPDKTYGIGNWSYAAFWNALHNGIGPGSSLLVFPKYLYPVMPWQDYNKLSYSDVMAIKAYLMTLQPVAAPDQPSQMHFPFTMRAGLLAWRLLFFNDKPIQYDPSWSPQVRNGAFLVQALAHCAECHTQRNLLMATEPSRYLAGGHLLAQSWYAPNISASKTDGIGGWSQSDLAQFLGKDGALGTGSPYGPMKAVVDDSLSRLPASDMQDIAAYLQTATPTQSSDMPDAAAVPPMSQGAQVYAENCARCHGANGEGVSNNFPNLAGNESLWDGPSVNIISMILGGYTPWHANQSSMPEFNQSLSDDQIAAVSNYVRTSWGNKGTADATADEVGAERGLSSDWVMLDTGTTQASIGNAAPFDDIAGQLELFGDRKNCMLNAQFNASAPNAPAKSAYLVGNCVNGGGALQGTLSVDGQTMPVTLSLQEKVTGSQISAVNLFGTLPGSHQSFNAHIALAAE